MTKTETPVRDVAEAPWDDQEVKLLVAAMDLELSAFPDELEGFDRLVSGIGKLRAAVTLAQKLERGSYDEIVVVGTSGSVDSSVGDGVHEIGAVVQHDVENIAGEIGAHEDLPSRLELERAGVTAATGDIFVQTSERAQRVRELGASMIDMETYSFVWVAQQYGVPIRVLRAVSDSAEGEAFHDFRQAIVRCSGQLRERIHELYGV